jgi:hypothetical protein
MLTNRSMQALAGMLFASFLVVVIIVWWFATVDHTPPAKLECLTWSSGAPVYRAKISTEYATNDAMLLGHFVPTTKSPTHKRVTSEMYLQFQPKARLDSISELLVHIQDANKRPLGDTISNSLGELPILTYKIQMGQDCRITLFNAENQKANPFVVGLLLLLDFRLPSTPLKEWTSEQQDKTGIYLADYKVKTHESGDVQINRQRERYLRLDKDLEQKGYRAHIVESDIVASLDSGSFWFSKMSGIEDLSILKDGAAVLQTRIEFDLQRMSLGFLLPPKIVTKELTSVYTRLEAEPVIPVLPEEVLRHYRLLINEGRMSDAVGALVIELKHNPAFADHVYAWLLDGSIGSNNIALTFLALSKASTAEAVTVLEAIFEDPDLPDQRRAQAAFALASLTPPSIEVAELLALQLDRIDIDQDFSSRSALMALGHMSSLIGDQDNATKSFISNAIENQFQLATSDQSIATALSAAHNSGDINLYQTVRLQLSNSSPRIRSLAIEALAKISSTECRKDIYDYLIEESDLQTKAIAIDSLSRVIKDSQTNARPEEVSLVAKIMKTTADSRIRKSTVSFLGAQLQSDKAKKALLQQVAIEKDPDILRALGQALSTEDLRYVVRIQGSDI